MPHLKITLPALHPRQAEVRDDPARFKVLACGRRWGKTLLGVGMSVQMSIRRRGPVWWIAPDYPRGKIGWRRLNHICSQIPGAEQHKGDMMWNLPGGGWVQVKSAVDPDSLKGEGLVFAAVDEAAMMKEIAWTEALRAALSDRRGSAIFMTTPKGRANWIYRLYQQALTTPGWAAWRLPTASNPYIEADEIEDARLTLPEWVFKQEYLAEFMSFRGRVFQTFNPDEWHVFSDQDVDLHGYPEYFGGIDFGLRNPTVLSVAGVTGDSELDMVDELYRRGMVLEEIIPATLERQEKWNVRRWWADPSEPSMIESMRRAGIRVVPAPRPKSVSEESWARQGITRVQFHLEQKGARPGLRFCKEQCPNHIAEHDAYHYGEVQEGRPEKEMPIKVDDHSCDSTRYLVTGYEEFTSSRVTDWLASKDLGEFDRV